MSDLGVDINLSKSLVSSRGVGEFAKRLISPFQEFTPLGPANLLAGIRNWVMVLSVLLDSVEKGRSISAWTALRKLD